MRHAYRPHAQPTWTIAVIERGAARFSLDATQQRADRGELFVLEPHAVHTGMAAIPEGWSYKVLYAACGFADQAHLTRTFKRAVGITPARYATS